MYKGDTLPYPRVYTVDTSPTHGVYTVDTSPTHGGVQGWTLPYPRGVQGTLPYPRVLVIPVRFIPWGVGYSREVYTLRCASLGYIPRVRASLTIPVSLLVDS